MKWRNHEAIGYALSYAVTGNLILSLVSIPMSIFPDIIEGSPQWRLVKHRGWSHNVILWILLCAFLGILAWNIPRARTVLIVMIIGSFSHIICDAITITGVPIWENRYVALGLFRMGSPVEYLLAFLVVFSCFGFQHIVYHQLQVPSINEAMDDDELEACIKLINEAMDEIRYIFYVLTQPHFASWLISVMPYNILSVIALVVGVWMTVFRGLHSFGMSMIVVAIALFFYGQSIQ